MHAYKFREKAVRDVSTLQNVNIVNIYLWVIVLHVIFIFILILCFSMLNFFVYTLSILYFLLLLM